MVLSDFIASSLATVRSVERAAALLKAFYPQRRRQTLAELARATGLDKGTARRLLHTLRACDLVDYDARVQKYSLSVGILTLSNAVDKGRELRELSASILTELSERTGATSFLFVPHGPRSLCIQRVRAAVPNFDAAWFEVGGTMPLNCGGLPGSFWPSSRRTSRIARLRSRFLSVPRFHKRILTPCGRPPLKPDSAGTRWPSTISILVCAASECRFLIVVDDCLARSASHRLRRSLRLMGDLAFSRS